MSKPGTRRLVVAAALLVLFTLSLCAVAVPAAAAENWSQVGADGLGSASNEFIMSLAVYGGRLYAGTLNNSANGARMYRSSNGSSWSAVTKNAFGFPQNQAFSSMAVFKDHLYVGTRNLTAGCEVWRYNESTWSRVSSGGFGVGAGNEEILALQVLNGYLYAGVANLGGGCRIWRSAEGAAWTQVVGQDPPGTYGTGPGFGDVNNNSIESMEVFNLS